MKKVEIEFWRIWVIRFFLVVILIVSLFNICPNIVLKEHLFTIRKNPFCDKCFDIKNSKGEWELLYCDTTENVIYKRKLLYITEIGESIFRWDGTQVEYDLIKEHKDNVVYFIKEDNNPILRLGKNNIDSMKIGKTLIDSINFGGLNVYSISDNFDTIWVKGEIMIKKQIIYGNYIQVYTNQLKIKSPNWAFHLLDYNQELF